MNQVRKFASSLLCLFLLTSCNVTSNTDQKPQRTSAIVENIPSQYETQVNETLLIDASVYVPNSLDAWEASTLTAQYYVVDEKLVNEQLLNHKKITSHIVDDIMPIGSVDKQHVYFTEDGIFVSGGIDCSYTSNLANFHKQLVYGPFENVEALYNLDRFENQPPLSFLSQADALERARQIFSDAKITVSDDYYMLTYEHIVCQEEEEKRANMFSQDQAPNSTGNYKVNWSEDDDTYYFEFRQMLNKWNIANQGLGNFDEGTLLGPSYLNVGINKNGYSLFKAYNTYEVIAIAEPVAILNFDSAIEKMVDIHSRIYTGASDTVCEIRLQYQPTYTDNSHINFFMIPVWSYRIHRVYDDGNNLFFHENHWLHINAYDGSQMM